MILNMQNTNSTEKYFLWRDDVWTLRSLYLGTDSSSACGFPLCIPSWNMCKK